mmetsp:Transcript_7743/g.22858  ORF Transcript_7743/g.22858 Transcript_7743/m.22858 type:complete len:227 (-) Transcript_7743:131-811(-)
MRSGFVSAIAKRKALRWSSKAIKSVLSPSSWSPAASAGNDASLLATTAFRSMSSAPTGGGKAAALTPTVYPTVTAPPISSQMYTSSAGAPRFASSFELSNLDAPTSIITANSLESNASTSAASAWPSRVDKTTSDAAASGASGGGVAAGSLAVHHASSVGSVAAAADPAAAETATRPAELWDKWAPGLEPGTTAAHADLRHLVVGSAKFTLYNLDLLLRGEVKRPS